MTADWPQPHEGIYGIDRGDNDLLSLNDRARPHRDALCVMGRLLRQATLASDRAPVVAALWDRMSHPVPGDLVIETSRLHRTPDDRLKGLGFLIAHRQEWAHTDPEWEAFCATERAAARGPGDRPHEDAWYIQFGPAPGDVTRWAPADFTVLPLGVTSRWLDAEAQRFLPAWRARHETRPT